MIGSRWLCPRPPPTPWRTQPRGTTPRPPSLQVASSSFSTPAQVLKGSAAAMSLPATINKFGEGLFQVLAAQVGAALPLVCGQPPVVV